MSNGINMCETSLSDNKLNSAPSLSPWRSVDCAGSVTCIVCHPKVKSWNCTTSPRAQSAGHDQGAVHDDGGWTAFHKTSQSSTSPSQRQFVSPSIASTGVPFFIVWPLRWMTSKSFKSSKSVSLLSLLTMSVLLEFLRLFSPLEATRLTHFLQVTRSSGSLHISFELSPVHSFTLSYTSLLAQLSFYLITLPGLNTTVDWHVVWMGVSSLSLICWPSDLPVR